MSRTVESIISELNEELSGIEWTGDFSFLINDVCVEIIIDEYEFFSCFELYTIGDEYVEVYISTAESFQELCLMVLSD